MYMDVFPAYISLYAWLPVYAWYLWRAEKSIESPGSGITDRCEPLCGYWELTLGTPEEQPVFLVYESSLWPLNYFLNIDIHTPR